MLLLPAEGSDPPTPLPPLPPTAKRVSALSFCSNSALFAADRGGDVFRLRAPLASGAAAAGWELVVAHICGVTAMAVGGGAAGEVLATCDRDGKCRAAPVHAPAALDAVLTGHPMCVAAVAAVPAASTLSATASFVSASVDGAVFAWQVGDARLVPPTPPPPGGIPVGVAVGRGMVYVACHDLSALVCLPASSFAPPPSPASPPPPAPERIPLPAAPTSACAAGGGVVVGIVAAPFAVWCHPPVAGAGGGWGVVPALPADALAGVPPQADGVRTVFDDVATLVAKRVSRAAALGAAGGS